ncbi:acetyl-CoA hydrolase/transferase family protein [Marinitoga aeolica]|uniref:Acetyl-CoA hydrolase/transferase family protein n=1 Tax=Marinitoga aeolica TaxID=2809031 RepID=A0ABY8PR65_9BACT|nr:acetyl-CoA hydrolase/transferase C-terminal domain-containing protein [Marinitoga aeolica]WGS65112.1 acetyl-CoA hydrolase/transferase family protein [Marinitoga aeolica]
MWKAMYENRLKNIEEVILSLPKRATIITGLASAEAQGLLENLHKYKKHFERLKVVTCLNMKEYDFFMNEEYEDVYDNHSWFLSPPTRKAQKMGLNTVDFIPNNLHMAGTDKLMAEKEEGNIVIFWGTVTPMHEKTGYFNLGISNVYELDVLENADMVILEVNDKFIWTHGETQVHISQANYIVENSWDIPELPIVEPTETEKIIAQYISELVDDGSTLQIGIGGIPNAVAKLLNHKKDLGIHTEMFTESMIDLFESGAITNMKKTLWKGKFVCTFALGTKRMYEWLNNNPGVWIMRGRYVNDPYIIAKNDNMVSINTAITIDLSGQVCSESLGTRQYSGTGGQLDTHRGAVMSKNGKGIIALRSTAKKGTISTIVPMLPQGSYVTVPRQDLDYVVTEYGVAHLRGKSFRERVKAMINISHPDFRDELKKEAKKLGYL